MAKYKDEERYLESLQRSREKSLEEHKKMNVFINQPLKGLDILFSKALSSSSIPRHTIHYKIYNHIPKKKDEKEAFYRVCKKLIEEKAEILEHDDLLGAISDVCEYYFVWLRDIESWEKKSHSPQRQFYSLVNHLLVKKKVPSFMYSVWFDSQSLSTSHHRDWFIQMGHGTSIKGDIHLPKGFTNKMLHHFMNAPEDYSVKEALLWGRVHALGGDERLVNCLSGSRLRNTNPDPFWDSVIKFFADNPMMDSAYIGPIIDYIQNQKFVPVVPRDAEGMAIGPAVPLQPNMSMKGRNPEALIRESDHWHEMVALEEKRKAIERKIAMKNAQREGGGRRYVPMYSYDTNLKWSPFSKIAPFEKMEGGKNNRIRYKIVELLSSQELREEGSAMSHCVGSYAGACNSGRTSIWSLRATQEGKTVRLATIEISRSDLTIVQVRGKRNVRPTEKEKTLIEAWASINLLRISRWI